MTSKLKCSFCGEELDTKNYYVHCHNPHCNTTTEMEGTEDMWQALMQAKQDLEITTKALKDMMESGGDGYHIARKALEQIEHKEK